MAADIPGSNSSNWLPAILQGTAPADAVSVVTGLLEAWIVVSRLWDRFHYRGMYEILDYDSTLEIMDSQGLTAVLRRREVIRFLQDNVVAIHDHAWGDGEIFAYYHCGVNVRAGVHHRWSGGCAPRAPSEPLLARMC